MTIVINEMIYLRIWTGKLPCRVDFIGMFVKPVPNKKKVWSEVEFDTGNIVEPLYAVFESVNKYGFGVVAGNAVNMN